MNPRIILSGLILLLGVITAFLPQKINDSTERNAKEMLTDIQTGSNLVLPDELIKSIINEDPSLQLIDVRTPEEYEKFNLPGSINIPSDSILNEDLEGYLNQNLKQNVFYSNGTTLSSEAWMLTRQKGYINNYILSGGLNKLVSFVINPPEPNVYDSEKEFEINNTRKAALIYFKGSTTVFKTDDTKGEKPNIPDKKKKKKTIEGGCS